MAVLGNKIWDDDSFFGRRLVVSSLFFLCELFGLRGNGMYTVVFLAFLNDVLVFEHSISIVVAVVFFLCVTAVYLNVLAGDQMMHRSYP